MGDNKGDTIIRLKELRKQFQTSGGPVIALEDVSLEIHSGKVFGIVGLSGAGKSTLVRCINYLEVPTSGRVIFEGKNLSAVKDGEKRLAKRSMGVIFQQFNLLAQRNVLQNVCFPLEIAGTAKGEAKERAEGLLRLVGLEDRMKAHSTQLSGGQRQRVATARAMATNPRVLLYDEVISALDPSIAKSILELLKKINKEMEITVIVITHEMAVIETICDRVTITDHSHIAEAGRVSEIFSGPKSDTGRQPIPGNMTAQRTSFGTPRQIRITFDGRESSESVIASMVPACKVPVNVMRVGTRDIEGKAMGQMIIQLPEDDTDAGRICNYLKTTNMVFEGVR